MDSVLQQNKECWICHTTQNLESHHIFFGTANRKQSEKYGMKIWLCNAHHTGSNDSVHRSIDRDMFFKRYAQAWFEEHKGTREEFREIFGRSYL